MSEAQTLAKRILVIEDERAIRRAIEFRLRKAGYDVAATQDGEEGFARALAEKPDLILLDLILPKIYGFEILKRFRADDRTKDIPVIVFTNLSQETDENEAMALGAADFIVKSDLSLDHVVKRIQKLLS